MTEPIAMKEKHAGGIPCRFPEHPPESCAVRVLVATSEINMIEINDMMCQKRLKLVFFFGDKYD